MRPVARAAPARARAPCAPAPPARPRRPRAARALMRHAGSARRARAARARRARAARRAAPPRTRARARHLRAAPPLPHRALAYRLGRDGCWNAGDPVLGGAQPNKFWRRTHSHFGSQLIGFKPALCRQLRDLLARDALEHIRLSLLRQMKTIPALNDADCYVLQAI